MQPLRDRSYGDLPPSTRAGRRHGRRRLHGHVDRGQRRGRGRADHLRRAARAARRRSIDVSGKVIVPGYIEPHTHPWCLYSPASLLEVAVPDGTTTLVYDNLFFFLSHGVDGLRSIVDADERRARPHLLGGADRAAVGLPDEASVRDSRSSRRCCRGPRSSRAARSRTGCRSRAASGRVAAGIAAAKARAAARRGPQRRRLVQPPQRALAAGISSDHEAITGDGGAGPAAARDVDDAAPVLAAAGPRGDAARPRADGRSAAAG